jgi:hydrogenase maturation factor HypF (carbamoyltransferase family)
MWLLSHEQHIPRRPVTATIGLEWHDVTPARLLAVMEREHLVAPVIGVMLDCGCAANGIAARDQVVVLGPEGNDVLARFRPVDFGEPPAGAAPWQLALAILDDAFEGDAPLDSLPLYATLSSEAIDAARAARCAPGGPTMLVVRHYAEALEALGWWRGVPAGPARAEWRAQAAEHERRRYRYEITRASHPWELDLRPAVRDATFELIGGERPARVTARFLNAIAAGTADLVRGAACIHGRVPVVLAGSCFRAAGLSARVGRELAGDFQIVEETQDDRP